MRICFATDRGGLDDVVSFHFGRCKFFTIVDYENGEVKSVKVIPNPGATMPRAAGITAAQTVADMGCQVVVAGEFGPKSSQVIAMAGIRPYVMPGVLVKEALKRIAG